MLLIAFNLTHKSVHYFLSFVTVIRNTKDNQNDKNKQENAYFFWKKHVGCDVMPALKVKKKVYTFCTCDFACVALESADGKVLL